MGDQGKLMEMSLDTVIVLFKQAHMYTLLPTLSLSPSPSLTLTLPRSLSLTLPLSLYLCIDLASSFYQ